MKTLHKPFYRASCLIHGSYFHQPPLCGFSAASASESAIGVFSGDDQDFEDEEDTDTEDTEEDTADIMSVTAFTTESGFFCAMCISASAISITAPSSDASASRCWASDQTTSIRLMIFLCTLAAASPSNKFFRPRARTTVSQGNPLQYTFNYAIPHIRWRDTVHNCGVIRMKLMNSPIMAS